MTDKRLIAIGRCAPGQPITFALQPDPLGEPIYRIYSPALDAWWHGVRWDKAALAMWLYGNGKASLEMQHLPTDVVVVDEHGVVVDIEMPVDEPVQMSLI